MCVEHAKVKTAIQRDVETFFFFLFKWFGNLVTMNWWNDLWLNEGLTSYFEYLGATFVEPKLSLVSANAY